MPEPFDIRHLRAHLRSFAFLRHGRSRLKLTTKDTKDTKNLLYPLPPASATVRGLDHYVTFCLYRRVPAADNGASGSASGKTNQQGGAAFVTTHWSVVLAARGESAEADAALEKICRTYWWPL